MAMELCSHFAMESRITRRASASAADVQDTSTPTTQTLADAHAVGNSATTAKGGRSPRKPRRGTGRPRGRPRGSTRKSPKNESRPIPEKDNAPRTLVQDIVDLPDSGCDDDEKDPTHSTNVKSPQQARTVQEATEGEGSSAAGGGSRMSDDQVYEEMDELPPISPSLPPTFVFRNDTALQKDTLPTTAANNEAQSTKSKGFLDEHVYNNISVGGTARMAEVFLYKRGVLEGTLTSSSGIAETTPGESLPKKRKLSTSISKATIQPAPGEKGKQVRQQHEAEQTAAPSSAASSSASAPAQKSYELSELMASVSSYGPELSTALRNLEATPKPTQVIVQHPTIQPQQPAGLLDMDPPTTIFHHPCIFSHDNRSMLTRDEHRRMLMYEAVVRKRLPGMSAEDKALWAEIQVKVEEERQRVSQWNTATVRSRISNYFNPAIRDALESKWSRGRTRVKEDYPQNYGFLHTIGLRRPGVTGAKEPFMSRAAPKKVSDITRGTTLTPDQLQRGLLHRTGHVCPVSLAKPIWPTDENGVPFEKTIDVDDRYWRMSASASEQPVADTVKARRDNRRGRLPVKRPVVAVSNDPLARQFVREQDVSIAIGASAMVVLAKTLPNLNAEWEIPVKVVLEPDEEGNMKKRVYVDKPLIPKRMTKLAATQQFYDGACKKLALVGLSSTDVSILSRSAQRPSASTSSNSEAIESQKPPVIVNDSAKSSKSATESETELPATESIPVPTDKEESEEGTLGSHTDASGAPSCHNLEYSLWTFGELTLLVRNRLHGYLNNTTPRRQVVVRSILDYTPDIGLSEATKSTMAGWWMATWIRDDRLLALARVDVSKNQFVQYMDPNPPAVTLVNPENPFRGVFSDLPAISIEDASVLKAQDREIQEWIKPNMRLIHHVLGRLVQLSPGQYLLGHKAGDVNANLYQAMTGDISSSAAAARIYDLHAAHQNSPQLVTVQNMEGEGGSSALTEDEPALRWTGTPDQIPGTFPYEDRELSKSNSGSKSKSKGKRGTMHATGGAGKRGAKGTKASE